MNTYFFKKNNSTKAFTIIETLVAITILMISIAGPLTIASKGLRGAKDANNTLTAAYLAQDAMEYLKNLKANNLLNGRSWLEQFGSGSGTLTSCDSPVDVCSINTLTGDPNSTVLYNAGIEECVVENCLLYTSTKVVTGVEVPSIGYTPSSIEPPSKVPSLFSRYFYIDQDEVNEDEAKIVVVVSWNIINPGGGNTEVIENQVVYENEIFNISL